MLNIEHPTQDYCSGENILRFVLCISACHISPTQSQVSCPHIMQGAISSDLYPGFVQDISPELYKYCKRPHAHPMGTIFLLFYHLSVHDISSELCQHCWRHLALPLCMDLPCLSTGHISITIMY